MQEPQKGIYQHYKGTKVEVLGTVSHSETLEPLVHYRHLEDGREWVRPLTMFMEKVTVEGKVVPRFRLFKSTTI